MTDPLSDVLALLDAASATSTGLVTGGDWAVRIHAFEGLKFNAVLRGAAWLMVEGEAPVLLGPGDGFILTRNVPFVMASTPDVPPADASVVFANARHGVAYYGPKDDFFVLGGKMDLDPLQAGLLLDGLPTLLLLPAGSSGADALGFLLQRLEAEVAMPGPGAEAFKSQIMHMLFIEGLRTHLAEAHGVPGWLGALRDVRLGRALSALHEEPSRAWTLVELADIAGMSRSSFAAHFKLATGLSPLHYLSDWRLQLAAKRLRRGGESVSRIALSLGFGSESAFSTSFRRRHGASPLQYRRSIPTQIAEKRLEHGLGALG